MIAPGYFSLLSTRRRISRISSFQFCHLFDILRYRRPPKQIANQMIFADIVAKEIDTLMLLAGIGIVRRRGGSGGQSI